MLYFLLSTLVLTLYRDVVLSLSIMLETDAPSLFLDPWKPDSSNDDKGPPTTPQSTYEVACWLACLRNQPVSEVLEAANNFEEFYGRFWWTGLLLFMLYNISICGRCRDILVSLLCLCFCVCSIPYVANAAIYLHGLSFVCSLKPLAPLCAWWVTVHITLGFVFLGFLACAPYTNPVLVVLLFMSKGLTTDAL